MTDIREKLTAAGLRAGYIDGIKSAAETVRSLRATDGVLSETTLNMAASILDDIATRCAALEPIPDAAPPADPDVAGLILDCELSVMRHKTGIDAVIFRRVAATLRRLSAAPVDPVLARTDQIAMMQGAPERHAEIAKRVAQGVFYQEQDAPVDPVAEDPYERMAKGFEKLAVLRKMWTAREVAAWIRGQPQKERRDE